MEKIKCQELVSSYNNIRRDSCVYDNQIPTCSKDTIGWISDSEDSIEIPEKDILKPVTTNYSTNSKIDANTNGNNPNQKINSSDTSTTKVQIVGELINNSVISSNGLNPILTGSPGTALFWVALI